MIIFVITIIRSKWRKDIYILNEFLELLAIIIMSKHGIE